MRAGKLIIHKKPLFTHHNVWWSLSFLSICFFLFYVSKITWIHEDANITFRVIDNALSGYGLRWNIDERVQVYTHPLWMLVLLIPSFLMKVFLTFPYHIYFASFLCSLLASAGVCLTLWRLFQKSPFALTAVMMLLVGSNAFTDYISSGLENPLSFVLLATFIFLALRTSSFYRLTLVVAFLATTRVDLSLIVMPYYLYHLWLHRKEVAVTKLVAAGLPAIVWYLFSLLYYGSFWPNTAYAKLHAGFSQIEYWNNGLYYWNNLTHYSPLTAFIVIGGLGIFAWLITKRNFNRHCLLLCGAYIYIIYIFYIGGDYMAGRFYGTPYLCILVVCVDILRKYIRPKSWQFFVISPCLLFSAWQDYKNWPYVNWQNSSQHIEDVANERYLRMPTCLFCLRKGDVEKFDWVQDGINLKQQAKLFSTDTKNRFVALRGSIGLTGLFAGEKVHIIDTAALVDPLLSQMNSNTRFRIGHFWRDIPAGYEWAVSTGDLSRMDPTLAEKYKDIQSITRAPLFSKERLAAILRKNI